MHMVHCHLPMSLVSLLVLLFLLFFCPFLSGTGAGSVVRAFLMLADTLASSMMTESVPDTLDSIRESPSSEATELVLGVYSESLSSTTMNALVFLA